MSEIKLHSEPSVSADNSKRFVKNTKGLSFERNHKPWGPNDIIEVSREEANQLHDEGFLVMDQDDLDEEKAAAKEKLESELKK